MALADILAGIGGATKGALDAYSWQKQQQADDEDRDLRRQEILARIKAMTDQLNKPPDDPAEAVDTVDDAGNPITKFVPRSQLPGQTFRKYTTPPKPEAPEPTINIDTVDDNGNPVTRVLPRSEAAGGTFPKYIKPEKPSTPLGTTPKDDPTLPRGVRQYLATFAGRYRDRATAKKELDGVLASLYQDHPNLDATKVYRMFDQMFPKNEEPSDDVDDMPDAAPPSAPAAPSAGPLGTTPRPAPPPSASPFGRGASAAPVGQPQPMAGAAPQQRLQVGAPITLKNGKRARVRAINPDGTVDIDPLP